MFTNIYDSFIIKCMDDKINPLVADSVPVQPKQSSSIFWIETDLIKPNPYQPRREFDQEALEELADSIRSYGILQPMVVTRNDVETETGHGVVYELLAGERRLRASKIAGLKQVPVTIRDQMADKVKLELALVENLQRENLNPIERARAFKQLADEFNMVHREIAKKMGKSREVVSNTIRLLALPLDMQDAVAEGKIKEGQTRPLLMLSDHQDDQKTLYNEMLMGKLSVRDAERRARSIAKSRARAILEPSAQELQNQLEDTFGTRVYIDKNGERGRISIEFFSDEEFDAISNKLAHVISSLDGNRFDSTPKPMSPVATQEEIPVEHQTPQVHTVSNDEEKVIPEIIVDQNTSNSTDFSFDSDESDETEDNTQTESTQPTTV
jgi:ParB family transcriptional regulator, chromosome partitioning protein